MTVMARAPNYNKKAKEVTMTTTSISQRQYSLGNALSVFAALVYIAFYLLGYFFIEEDSYIYFRVAENIAHGYGYVFNIGDIPIESGSGPLWQFLLALGVLLGCNVVVLAKLMGMLFGLATLYVFHHTAGRLSTPVVAGWLTLALAASVPFIWWTGSGLEVSLYTLLLSVCVAVACAPEPYRDGWLSVLPFALLLFARPEAFISVGVFVLYLLASDRRALAFRTLLLAALSYGGYLVFRYFYFDEVQISAFYAKISVDGVLWDYLWTALRQYRLVYLLALVLPAALLWRRDAANGPFVLLLLLSCGGLYFAAANYDFKIYHRFFAHSLPVLLLLVAVAIARLLAFAPKTLKPVLVGYVAVACIAVAWMPRVPGLFEHTRNPFYTVLDLLREQPATTLSALGSKLAAPHATTVLDDTLQARVPYVINANYQALVGHFLHDNYPQGLTIGYDQMGQTPYFAGAQQNFVDFLGLATRPISLYYFNQNARDSKSKTLYKQVVDPLLQHQRPEDRDIDQQGALASVEQSNPDVIIIHTLVASSDKTLTYHVRNSDWFKQNYVLRYSLATWLLVYERKDLSFPLKAKNLPAALQFREMPDNG